MRGQTAFTLFQSLPPEVMADLARVGSIHRYSDKQLIAQRGECERQLNVVDLGCVRVSNVDVNGRRTETAVLEAGDSFGEFTLLAGMPRFFDFHAQGETRIRTISKSQFDTLMQGSAVFRDSILTMLTHRLLSAVGIIEDIRRLPLSAQLAKFLLHCCEQQADGSWLYQGTQTDLADALGVSRVSIGQALKALREAGLIGTGYGYVPIRNKPALQLLVMQRSTLVPT